MQLTTLLALSLLLAACGGNSGAWWGPGSYQGNNSTHQIIARGGLIIQASPVLAPALQAMLEAFLKARKLNVPIVFDFSSAKIIANNANVQADSDLLITDNSQTMIDARNLGFTRSIGTPLARDYLSVILPPANPGKIHTLQDLARPGLRYLGILPNGGLYRHIQTTLESMLLDPTFGPHYAARVYGNLIQNYTDGLSAARALAVSSPPGDFAIVYHTDYLEVQKERGARSLLTLSIPTPFNPPILMLAAITGQASNPTLAQQFTDFMRSSQGQKIWTQYGFQPPSSRKTHSSLVEEGEHQVPSNRTGLAFWS